MPETIKLLLVEDSPADVVLIRESLKSCSVPVHLTVVEDGARALCLLNATLEPDLIILDLNVPWISGLELLTRHGARDIPTVIFSSSQNPEDKKQAIEFGAREYVTKPIDLDEFAQAVCGIVEKWGVKRGNGALSAPG